jgi:hypothetical protein
VERKSPADQLTSGAFLRVRSAEYEAEIQETLEWLNSVDLWFCISPPTPLEVDPPPHDTPLCEAFQNALHDLLVEPVEERIDAHTYDYLING